MCDDRGRDTALQVAQQPSAAMRAEHDQGRVVFVGGRDDALPGRRRLNGHAARQESGVLSQRCPMGGGLLGCLPYLGGPVGVEVLRVGWREPDFDGLPDTHDQRVAARRQLGGGLRDRERGEF